MRYKFCKACGVTQSEGNFYANKKGGLSAKCKECTKKAVRDNRIKKLAYYREYDRRRYYEGGYRYANGGPSKEAVNRNKRAYDQKHQEKRQAKVALNNALRDGRIEREPCCVCGREDTQAHHEDYSKPLAVVWLCPEHHAQHHRILEELAQRVADAETEKR